MDQALASRLDDGVGHALSVMPFRLTAYCLADRPADAARALDDFIQRTGGTVPANTAVVCAAGAPPDLPLRERILARLRAPVRQRCGLDPPTPSAIP